MAKRRVLVTGACGYIAAQLLPALRERYDLTLLDTRTKDRDGRPVEDVQLADLTNPDLEANRSYFRGIDSVVHLGYIHPSTGQGSPTIELYRAERTNVDMAFHVFQLAMEEGVRRVVVASSNHAADWYEHLLHAKIKDVVDPGSGRSATTSTAGRRRLTSTWASSSPAGAWAGRWRTCNCGSARRASWRRRAIAATRPATTATSAPISASATCSSWRSKHRGRGDPRPVRHPVSDLLRHLGQRPPVLEHR